jgi:hypothetical protein
MILFEDVKNIIKISFSTDYSVNFEKLFFIHLETIINMCDKFLNY